MKTKLSLLALSVSAFVSPAQAADTSGGLRSQRLWLENARGEPIAVTHSYNVSDRDGSTRLQIAYVIERGEYLECEPQQVGVALSVNGKNFFFPTVVKDFSGADFHGAGLGCVATATLWKNEHPEVFSGGTPLVLDLAFVVDGQWDSRFGQNYNVVVNP